MKKSKEKRKASFWLSMGVGIITLGFVFVMLFIGSIDVEVKQDGITAKATLTATTEIDYKDIEEVKLVKDIDLGKRTNGLGDFTVQAGHFKNTLYGKYMLYSYNKCDTYVEITLKDGTHVVLNEKTEQKTKELYEKIMRYRSQD